MSRLLNIYEAFLKKVPQQSRSRSVVEAILGAASERLVVEGDEERVTVHAVAERAGVGIASLYDYFGDRGNLLAAIAAKVTEDNRHAFEAMLASTADLSSRRASLAWSTSASIASRRTNEGHARFSGLPMRSDDADRRGEHRRCGRSARSHDEGAQ